MNGQHSEQVTRAWGPTAAAAVVACLPPAAMATSIGCAGLGLAMDSTAVAASGAVAATVGMVAQRSAGRRLRRRLRQERARNRLELHDLEIRLEQATRHLAEAVALAEAATRAMSGAPLVLTAEGAVVAKTLTPAAQAALVAEPAAVPVAAPVVEPAAPAAEADTEVIEAVPALPAPVAEPERLELPVLPRRVAAAAVSEHLKDAARVNAEVAGRVAARLADPVFGQPVVPATPADLFTPANGLPVAGVETDDAGWFAPRRSGNGLPPAPLSPAVGISLPVSSGPVPGSGMPPGQREPVSGALTLVGAEARATRLPARLADARVVDLSTLAHPESSGLIVVRRGGRHAAPPVAADHVA